MKPIDTRFKKSGGWLLFIAAIGLFCLQMGFLFLQSRYDVEYTDNRMFYLINLLIAAFMAFSIFLLFTVTKKVKLTIASVTALLILLHAGLLVHHSQKTNQVISLSPDLKHLFVIKENKETSQAVHYRTSYWLFARPQETLPYKTSGEFKVKWLEKDIAAVTYKADDGTTHQYVGTYGDRDGGTSYTYVGPTLQGTWKGTNARVISSPEGITIEDNGEMERYEWDTIVQFGTLAVVLVKNNQAHWTIALNETFKSNSNEPAPPSGTISLYKATMDRNDPIIMEYVSSD
jgi:hypothetical protein